MIVEVLARETWRRLTVIDIQDSVSTSAPITAPLAAPAASAYQIRWFPA
jgi:hypothetical protein